MAFAYIGSAVAPGLSEVFLRFLDGAVKSFVDSQAVGSIYVGNFVDNSLVCAKGADVAYQLNDLIVAANNCILLHFTLRILLVDSLSIVGYSFWTCTCRWKAGCAGSMANLRGSPCFRFSVVTPVLSSERL